MWIVEPFDPEIIRLEFDTLKRSSRSDTNKLAYCLKRIEESGPENPHPALVKSFGDRLYEVRHTSNDYAGRAFVMYERDALPAGKVIILHVFRKESKATPERHLTIARKRQKIVEGKK